MDFSRFDQLPHTLLYDNSDLNRPLRQVAHFEQGRLVQSIEPLPDWGRLRKPFQ